MAAEIDYSVRRSTRAKRVRVKVDLRCGVEVVLPSRAPRAAAAIAVQELRPWIERRLTELAATRAQLRARAGTVPYLGRPFTLVPQPERVIVRRVQESLLVPEGDCKQALERFYRRSARREIALRLDAASAAAGLTYERLTIRGQRTRWASCSVTGAMSFNWRLLLAPERVLEYVVWHEVCHLRVRDHSPAFWALVEQWWPTWRQERAWLRRNGATLVL